MVVGVALRRREARLADQRLDLGERRPGDVPGGQVDVLLEQRAAEVVGAEVERDLGFTLLSAATAYPPGVPLVEAATTQSGTFTTQQADLSVAELARTLAQISIIDIAVFFAVLLVGFAYVWKRGDLDWVRALSRQRAMRPVQPSPVEEETHALSA